MKVNCNFFSGLDAVAAGTIPAGCGNCFRANTTGRNPWSENLPEGVEFNMAVIDSCPYNDNKENCPLKPGDVNANGYQYHFDLYARDIGPLHIGENPEIAFEPIECPAEILALMEETCCGTWWKDQGCPRNNSGTHHYGICDPALFDCQWP